MDCFVAGNDLSKAINEILREDTCRCAVAFWGKGARKNLATNAAQLKLICNLRSGGTNPFEIEKLLRISIRQCDTLHARFTLAKGAL
jgi:hypothetical protein